MKIDLVPGAIPYKPEVRPLNSDQKDNLHEQIDEWLEQGVIKPSVSPWASPLVPMKKKDGEMGHTFKRIEQANGQGQLQINKYPRDPPQSARRYSVLLSGCLSCSMNQTWQPCMYSIWHLPVYMNAFWII